MLIHNLLRSVRLLADATRAFAGKLVDGLEVNRPQLAANVENALLLATALNSVLGYDNVARITTKALADRIQPREAAAALGLLEPEEYDRLVDPQAMLGPRPTHTSMCDPENSPGSV